MSNKGESTSTGNVEKKYISCNKKWYGEDLVRMKSELIKMGKQV